MIIFILSVLVVFTVLIGIHEVGHLVAAKLSGVGVEKFSIGYGPAILKKKLGGTVYQLSLVPFGGYVKMEGEDFDAPGFYTMPARRKIGVTVWGPIANLLLAFLISFALLVGYGEPAVKPALRVEPGLYAARAGLSDFDLVVAVEGVPVPTFGALERELLRHEDETARLEVERGGERQSLSLFVKVDSLGLRPYIPAVVGRIKDSSPARKLGLRPGDEVVEVDGRPVEDWEGMVTQVRALPGKAVELRWKRDGHVLAGTVTPSAVQDESGKPIGQLGVVVRTERQPVNPLYAVARAGVETYVMTRQTFDIIGKLIVGRISRRAVGGPVLIAQLTMESARWGLEYYLFLLALLSINLFIINLIPIPALDGGRILMFLLEKLLRRSFTKKEWNIALQVGYGFVILLAVFVTFNDITRLLGK